MKRYKISFFSCCVYFLIIAITTTAAVIIYSAINGMESWKVTLIMFVVILALTTVCTVADVVRRKLFVERAADEISAAAELMAKGNFDVRLTPRHEYKNYDEYDRIMVRLNLLASELSKTEILRNDFVSNVSHEIKTPLSVISNYAAALKKGGLDSETQQKYLDTLINASKRLSDLVVNILKLNKLENSSIPAEMGNFDLGENLRECVLAFEEIIDNKNIELDCDIEDMRIYSDKSFLETVWNNLISNAVKFTPDGGRITVKLKRNGSYAEVSVSDTGCGIDPETGAHIFDKFYQGDTSHASEGNGLGLAMVKRVIDILGGEINVESEPGKGSTFTVRIGQIIDELS